MAQFNFKVICEKGLSTSTWPLGVGDEQLDCFNNHVLRFTVAGKSPILIITIIRLDSEVLWMQDPFKCSRAGLTCLGYPDTSQPAGFSNRTVDFLPACSTSMNLQWQLKQRDQTARPKSAQILLKSHESVHKFCSLILLNCNGA